MQGDGHPVLYYDNPPPNTSPTVRWASDVYTPDANTSPNQFEMRNDGNMHVVRKSLVFRFDGQNEPILYIRSNSRGHCSFRLSFCDLCYCYWQQQLRHLFASIIVVGCSFRGLFRPLSKLIAISIIAVNEKITPQWRNVSPL